jgi:hypothetical protein
VKKHVYLAFLMAFFVVLSGIGITLWVNDGAAPLTTNTPPQSSGYLPWSSNSTKIYLVSTSSSWSTANETYIAADGRIISAGSSLFVVTVVVRNDYTADEPAPPVESPISPADGTAYLCLTAQPVNGDASASSSLVTGDFQIPGTQGTGLVLASGQTASAQILVYPTLANVGSYRVGLSFLGDCIPT